MGQQKKAEWYLTMANAYIDNTWSEFKVFVEDEFGESATEDLQEASELFADDKVSITVSED